MVFQIDQSNKIEQTNKDTVIALSNEVSFVIVVPSKAKQAIKIKFRRAKKPHLFFFRTFAVAVALLIEKCPKKFSQVTIDTEYKGRERLIKAIIKEAMVKLGNKNDIEIIFKQIGKSSNAHKIAYLVMHKKRKPNAILTLKELEELIFK
jgi:hypothetical protein